VALLALACLVLFLVWRIDSPRVERLRADVVDAVVPRLDWMMAPVTAVVGLAQDVRSYSASASRTRSSSASSSA
jgi:rod shape-determining protein MreC